MKRKLAKKLDYVLKFILDMRKDNIMPSQKYYAILGEVTRILKEDGLIMWSERGEELTDKGLAFLQKGGYMSLWNDKAMKVVWPIIVVVIGTLLSWMLSLCLN